MAIRAAHQGRTPECETVVLLRASLSAMLVPTVLVRLLRLCRKHDITDIRLPGCDGSGAWFPTCKLAALLLVAL
eukprot:12457578-Alexandrium_andersonii.AAC.1